MLAAASVVFNAARSLLDARQALSASGTCDLYMMNREGPRFRHVVLSRESSAKGLNSPFDAGTHDRAAWLWKRPLSVRFLGFCFFLECVTAAGSRRVWKVP